MSFVDEIKRMKTAVFWKRVGYWCSIKWSGRKTSPIQKEDWLPILTSIGIGIILIIIFLIISNSE